MGNKVIIDNPFVNASQRLNALEDYMKNGYMPLKPVKTASKIDLHLHTNYSDGYWTPTGLILEACKKGMKLISLTDHDGFTGIKETFDALTVVKKVTGSEIGFVPGIEFSTNYFYGPENKKEEVHILGYFPAETYEDFNEYLSKLDNRTISYMEAFQKNRILRVYEMITKFNELLPSKVPGIAKLKEIQNQLITDKTATRGIRGSIAASRLQTASGLYEVYNLYINGRIDEITDETFSTEYLDALAELCSGFNSSKDFMDEYFGKNKPSEKTGYTGGYIGLTESPEWVIKTIRNMSGIPVLAHPAKYMELYKDLLFTLVPLGLKGIEVFSDNFTSEVAVRETVAFVKNKYPNLVITIGSDCHGSSVDQNISYRPDNIMGLKTDFDMDISEYYTDIFILLSNYKHKLIFASKMPTHDLEDTTLFLADRAIR